MTKLLLLLVLCTVYKAANSQFATCTSKEVCIPFKDCDAIQEILKKGPRLSAEDKQYFKKVQCKSENRLAYVCCAKKVNLEELLPTAPHCGFQFSDKIVGGQITHIEEYPWTVQIQYAKRNGQIESHCGGALINKQYVLTAAHCHSKLPKGYSLAQVRLGDWDVRTNPDCDEEERCNDPYVEIPIDKVIVHESYNPQLKAQSYDIALIKLQKEVQYSEFIKPICLPIDPNVRNIDMTNHDVEVAGYGRTENSSSSDIKMKVGLTVSSQETCENIYSRQNVVITNKQLCAGGELGKDSCNGDSGGPLMKQVTKPGTIPYFMLIGIVSFGPSDCGTKDHPAVYTRVSEYMDWITNNMD